MSVKSPIPDFPAGASTLDTPGGATSHADLGSVGSFLGRLGLSGRSIDLERELLLTLMGELRISDSCIFALEEGSDHFIPVRSYGALDLKDLLPIPSGIDLVSELMVAKGPVVLGDLPLSIRRTRFLTRLFETMQIVTPIGRWPFAREGLLRDRNCPGGGDQIDPLLGFVFLGKKIGSKTISTQDRELISALCAVATPAWMHLRIVDRTRSNLREVLRLSSMTRERMNRLANEFRSPLTVLKAGLGCLEPGEDGEEIFESLTGAVDSMHSLVESLCKLYQGSREKRIARQYNANRIVEAGVSSSSESAASRGLRFRLTFASGGNSAEPHLRESTFRSMVESLIECAVLRAPKESVITISTEILDRGPNKRLDGEPITDWRLQTREVMAQYENLADRPTKYIRGIRFQDMPRSGLRQKARQFLVLRVSDRGKAVSNQDLQSIRSNRRYANCDNRQATGGWTSRLLNALNLAQEASGYVSCLGADDGGVTVSVFIPVNRA